MNNNYDRDYGSIAPSQMGDEDRSLTEDEQQDSIGNHASSKKYWIFFGCLALTCYSAVIYNSNHSFTEVEEESISTSVIGSRHQVNNILLDSEYDEKELYFHEQLIDHMSKKHKKTYPQRYYKKSKYWKGPGYPILFLVGGEASLEPPMLFPFVNEGLAKEFNAYVVSPELRFYGKSQPVKNPTNEDLVQYLSPDQGLADSISLVTMLRKEIGCSQDPTSHKYCPVITFGGSYPGFLSAMMRFRFPNVIDISYASSAPLKLYSQEVDPNAYFDKITQVAEAASPGCASAVRSTMAAVRDDLMANYTSVHKAAGDVGFCHESVPHYIQDIPTLVSETIMYLIPAIFADFNMAYYPPGPTTPFERACSIFLSTEQPPLERMVNFFALRGESEYGADDDEPKQKCFDLNLELPTGPHARIRGSDNSGTGGGFAGEMWDFQCCKDLGVRVGYSEESMFLPRPFSYAWHRHHCHDRFEGVPVEPFRMVEQWGFDDLSNASRILFTVSTPVSWSSICQLI